MVFCVSGYVYHRVVPVLTHSVPTLRPSDLAGLYSRVLDRYAGTRAIPLADLLRADRPVAESLAAVLEDAAHRYAADPAAAGCLVLEGIRCNDQEAREAARAFHAAAEDTIRGYIAARHPQEAGRVTDLDRKSTRLNS